MGAAAPGIQVIVVTGASDGIGAEMARQWSARGERVALVLAARNGKDSVIIISADASSSHQSVITVMEAARRSGLNQITFATESSAQAGKR